MEPARSSTPAADSRIPAQAPASTPPAAGSSSPPAAPPAAGSSSLPDSTPADAGSAQHAPAEAVDASIAASIAPDPPVERGPYFVSGAWHGYFWLAQHGAGTTVTATNFDAEQFGAPICIRGLVASTPDNTGNAILGVNLNQTNTSDMSVQTASPTLDGVRVALTNDGGSLVRLQIQALDGATNEHSRWCAEVSGTGGFVPWSRFNTACWDGSGAPYRREAISGAMLLIPGATTTQTAFDICLAALAEASAPASSVAAGSGS